MNIVSVENLTKSFGEKLLFENISFGIEAGQKIALISRNGAGKSSLIKIITGEEAPDSGKVTIGNNVRISYLPQNPVMDHNSTILDYLFDADDELTKLVREYEHYAGSSQSNKHVPVDIISRMDELQAWNFEASIREILGKFDINDLDQTIETLSGGMRKKVALAKALIGEANLIILDEPTNHLDIAMIEWLENFLDRQNLSIFVVTHDRYFLDKVCNIILELDNQTIYRYKGNYAHFLEKKAEMAEIGKTEWEKARSLYISELEWMKRQPQARATKAKAREQAFYSLEEKVKGKRADDKPREFIVQMQRLGGKILELNYISKQYDDNKLIEDFTYTFKRGDRIGVVGKNGTGKSTLLKIIIGEIKPDRGKVVKGQTLKIGYFQQDGMPITGDKRIIDIVKEIAEQIVIRKGSMSPTQFLSYFNFHTDIHYNYFSSLSGGEKRKLYLLTVLLQNPNFLILDEPTNDLDIETLNKLEEFLQNYEGCLMIVSHDRYFMDRMVDHIFAFEGNGKVKDYYGNYSEYYQTKQKQEKALKAKRASAEKPINKVKKESNKPTYRQIKEYETLTTEIELLEKQKEDILSKLNSGTGTVEELQEWSNDVGEIMKKIDELTDLWLELSEIIEGS
ncbi:MAG: ATP-binding cassette domain-containing protein [Bacteroidales bacterium]|jgi:ATP-binding cassette subfamily F protein uup|nr:ATP-binding cassette domain-containing protein [Bacteroidales bacterium]